MEIRFPMWLRVVDKPGATVFAALSATEAFSRALVAGVIPLEAYRLLDSARNVSLAYTVIGVVALLASFAVPVVIRVIRRKWIFSAGCVFMMAAPLLMLAETAIPFVGALQFRALAVVCVNISLNLYILDYIARKDFVTAEPRRLAFMGVAWFTGPGLGIYLYKTFGLEAVCVPSAIFAVVALAYFWVLRMREDPRVAPAKKRPPHPGRISGAIWRSPGCGWPGRSRSPGAPTGPRSSSTRRCISPSTAATRCCRQSCCRPGRGCCSALRWRGGWRGNSGYGG